MKHVLKMSVLITLIISGSELCGYCLSRSSSLMPVGVYYYPEQWNSKQWDRDLHNIASLGFEFTHYGEFAWDLMEPEEGKFDFEWLDKAIELADKNGLNVILCTPTATPPAWLTAKHPEILTKDANGVIQQHGSRLHVSYNHPTYLSYVKKIVEQLALRYGNDSRVIGWQVDNEPHYGVIYDYSDDQQTAFRVWLRKKYPEIDELNYAWGTTFWSQRYNNFNQVRIPNKSEASQGSNPHALLDFQRFQADQLAESLRFQITTLREHITDAQFITTNYAYYKSLPSVDPFRSQQDFDFASHTMYMTSQYLNDSNDRLAHRLGSGMELSFSQEFAQSINGRTGIMELQPGQINWGKFNPQPLPGAVRMWIWHAFGLGDDFLCTYRFRQPLFGNEQFHKGIVETDGITVSRGGVEFVEALNEIKSLDTENPADEPADYSSRRTAILWDQDSYWDLENGKLTAFWDTWQFYYTYYESLKSMGVPVTFVRKEDQLNPEKFPFLLVLACQIVDSEQIEKWKKYVESGGHLVITSRTGFKDNNGHLWEQKPQEPIGSLIGAEIQFYDQLSPEVPGRISYDSKDYKWYAWSDILTVLPNSGTEVLSTHIDQFYRDTPTATRCKIGKGSVTYVGTWTSEGEFERQLLRDLYQENGAPILDLPKYVFVEWSKGYWVAVNYTAEDVEIDIPDDAEMLLGDKNLKPAGVTVWR